MTELGFETRQPDRALAFNAYFEVVDTFINLAETNSFLDLIKDLLPPGPGWGHSTETA